MIFPTLQFAIFFALVLPLSWALMPRPRLWKPFMIAASYVFYGSADAHFVLLLAGCTAWNQVLATLIGRAGRGERVRSWLLALAIAGDLGLLGWFKYYGFFAGSVAAFTARLGLPAPLPLLQVVLPLGISFFTFQAMSYVVDVRRGQCPPARTAAHRGGPRVGSHLRRPAQESAGRRPPRDPAGRPGLWRPAAALAARCTRGHLRLRRADLLRLLGLLGHGHRACAPPGLPVPPQLQPPLCGGDAAGLLAPLAHEPVSLVAGLLIHWPGRQPARPPPHLRQPPGHHAPRRPMARGRVEIRALGWDAWRRPRGRALVG